MSVCGTPEKTKTCGRFTMQQLFQSRFCETTLSVNMLRKETSSHVMSRCRDCLLWGCGAFPVPCGIYQADRDLSCCFSNKVTHQREGINRARICTYHCGHDLKRLWTWLKVSSNYKRLSKACFGMSSSCNYIQYTTGKHARTIQDTYKFIYIHIYVCKGILKLDNSKDNWVCVCVWCLWAWIISKCKKPVPLCFDLMRIWRFWTLLVKMLAFFHFNVKSISSAGYQLPFQSCTKEDSDHELVIWREGPIHIPVLFSSFETLNCCSSGPWRAVLLLCT